MSIAKKAIVPLSSVLISPGARPSALSLGAHKIENDLDSVFILHGLFGSSNNFRTISKQLSKTLNKNFILVDLRNHGTSPHIDSMTFPEMASDVSSLIESYSLSKPPIILGHSLGGKVAMSTGFNYPESVCGLIIVDIAPVHYESLPINNVVQAMQAVDLSRVGSKVEVDNLLSVHGISDPVTRSFILTNLIRDLDRNFYWKCNFPLISREFSSLANFDCIPQTKSQNPFETDSKFEKPTLFIHGTKSPYLVPSKHQPRIDSCFTSYDIQPLEAGHWVHFEQPKQFMSLISDWIAKKL